jgi:mono/diheme cytochrome c family protein
MHELSVMQGVALFLSAATATSIAQNAAHPGDPQVGRQLALRACDTCHIVAANQEIKPLVPGYAPSFFDVATKPGVTAQSLEDFLAHKHPYAKMPNPQLSAAQVSDIASYIVSLRGRH